LDRPKRPYSLNKRSTTHRNRFIYYIRFRHPDSGEYLSAVSSGHSTRAGAMNWAEQKIRSGEVTLPGNRNLTFEKYATGFWDYERSPYIQHILLHGGTFSRTFARIRAGYCTNYILPAFFRRRLDSLKWQDIERWLLSLKQNTELSATTINKVPGTFRLMLREAVSEGIISTDPIRTVRPLREVHEEKGIFTAMEVRRLFSADSLHQIWQDQLQYQLINMIAASTGMRMGEIRALTWECVYEDTIEVRHSWEDVVGLKETKARSNRQVTIPSFLANAFSDFRLKTTTTELSSLVFPGRTGEKPLDKTIIQRTFSKALETIGLPMDEQRSRWISFHSWRHWFNSSLRGHIPDEVLRLMTGHRTARMTDHYTHIGAENQQAVRMIQETLFGNDNPYHSPGEDN